MPSPQKRAKHVTHIAGNVAVDAIVALLAEASTPSPQSAEHWLDGDSKPDSCKTKGETRGLSDLRSVA
jgi:hypothetical protein